MGIIARVPHPLCETLILNTHANYRDICVVFQLANYDNDLGECNKLLETQKQKHEKAHDQGVIMLPSNRRHLSLC